MPCICKCRSDEIEKEKQKDEYEQRMHAINRLKDASMMASKFRDADFSGYKVREENQEAYKLALNYVKKFREMKEKNQGLLLYGPVGTGKSFTAACIANALMEQNITVIMTSFVKILQDIGTGDEASYIQILNSASLLIIDDLGTELANSFTTSQLYYFIEERHMKQKSTIISTNLSFQELRERYSERIFSRFTGYYNFYMIAGDDIRIKIAIS